MRAAVLQLLEYLLWFLDVFYVLHCQRAAGKEVRDVFELLLKEGVPEFFEQRFKDGIG